jgi:hypothetical protein
MHDTFASSFIVNDYCFVTIPYDEFYWQPMPENNTVQIGLSNVSLLVWLTGKCGLAINVEVKQDSLCPEGLKFGVMSESFLWNVFKEANRLV